MKCLFRRCSRINIASRLLLLILAGITTSIQAQPIDLMFTVETSPGTEQSIGLLNRRALQPGDRAGVISVTGSNTRVLQPLTADRDLLASALQKAGFRLGFTLDGAPVTSGNGAIDLVTAIKRSCEGLQRSSGAEKHAILILFGSEDPGLRYQLEVLHSFLQAANTRLYAVVINLHLKEQSRQQLKTVPTLPSVPAMTAPNISELAEQSGGQVFRGAWDLRDIVKDIRKP